jgi:ATP-dependent DNA ligase
MLKSASLLHALLNRSTAQISSPDLLVSCAFKGGNLRLFSALTFSVPVQAKMSKQPSIASFFGAAAAKKPAVTAPSTAPQTAAKKEDTKPADGAKAETVEDKPETAPAAKRSKPNPAEDEEQVKVDSAASSSSSSSAAPAAAAKTAPSAATSASGPAAKAAAAAGGGSSSSSSSAAVVTVAPLQDPNTLWEAVTDTEAFWKKHGKDGVSSSSGYHPIKDIDWPITLFVSKGAKPDAVDASLAAPEGALRVECVGIPYASLVKVFGEIEKTTKRLEITSLLTNFFRSVILTSPDDLLPCLYLCTNTIAAPYENLELGVGDSLLMKALAEATGRQLKDVKASHDEKGDLGLVAEESRSKQKTLFSGSMFGAAAAAGAPKAAVTVKAVFGHFLSIARESGKSSQDKKVATIKKLMVNSNGMEAKYIVRSMQGKLRIGLAKQTVLVALAHAFAASGPALEKSVAAAVASSSSDKAEEEQEVVDNSSEEDDSNDSDEDDEDAVVGSKRKKPSAAASKKKAGAAAGSGSTGGTKMENWLGVTSSSSSSAAASADGSAAVTASGPSETGLKALGNDVLAALEEQGVAVQEFHLSTKTRAAVDCPKKKVSPSSLVYRKGLSSAANAAAPTGVKLGGSASSSAASAAAVIPVPPAVLEWKSTLSLNSDKHSARNDAAVVILKQVYSELPNFEIMLPSLLNGGLIGALEACSLTGGVPVAPMLAKPTKGVREVLDRFEGVSFTCEYKYDGERAQVHLPDDGQAISVFSRNSENTTGKYPDIAVIIKEAMVKEKSVQEVEVAVPSAAASDGSADGSAGAGGSAAMEVIEKRKQYKFPLHSCVLDGEVVAYDRDKGSLMPFQVLSTRARKDVTVDTVKVQVVYAAFDMLLVNGVSLLHVPLRTRRALLRMFFHEIPGKFQFAQSSDSSDVEEISNFLNESVKGGCEGLMVKVLDGAESVYEPSKRSLNWLKLKKDYMDGLTDSLDLVPIAAWKGKGKRTGVYGAYLLACYDPEEEVYQAITKIGTGFSDEMLQELTQAMDSKEGCKRATKPSNVLVGDALMDADVWFDPDASEVWEVKAADLSISPVHMAALGRVNSEKGVALRFPRFIRRRDDKGPVDATNAEQVEAMYRAQSATVVSKGGAGDDEDEW